MTKLKKIGIKNFRGFKEEIFFDLSPLTILTGPNNSGKSTLIRALQILKESAEKTQLLRILSHGSETKVNTFKNAINGYNDNGKISFTIELEEFDLEYKDIHNKTRNCHFDTLKIILNYTNDQHSGIISEFVLEEKNELLFEIRIENGCPYVTYDKIFVHDLNDLEKSEIGQIKKDKIGGYPGGDMMDFRSTIDQVLKRINQNDESNREAPDEDEYNLIEPDTNYPEKGVPFSDHFFIYNFIGITICKISEFLDGQLYYFPTFRDEPLREFKQGDKNYLSGLIFRMIDENRQIYTKSNKTYSNKKGDYEFIGHDPQARKGIFNLSNKFISDFKIGKGVKCNPLTNGNYELRLYQSEDKGELGVNIADLGFGTFQLLNLFLTIEFCIGEKQAKKKNITILIEEPELSLHPDFQSKLADVFAFASKEFGINFIIETHSEYIIEQLQLIVAKKEVDRKSILINYLSKNTLKKIEIRDDGSLTDNFGEGFIDHSAKIIFELWKVRGLN